MISPASEAAFLVFGLLRGRRRRSNSGVSFRADSLLDCFHACGETFGMFGDRDGEESELEGAVWLDLEGCKNACTDVSGNESFR